MWDNVTPGAIPGVRCQLYYNEGWKMSNNRSGIALQYSDYLIQYKVEYSDFLGVCKKTSKDCRVSSLSQIYQIASGPV